MQNLIRRLLSSRYWRLFFLIGVFVSGCAYPSERIHPQFSNHRQSMGVMLVLQPEIHILEQLPDGSQLLQESQSREAQLSAQVSIVQALRDRGFAVRSMDTQPLAQADVDEVTHLFRSVNRSIQLHTFGPQIYPDKIDAFEYSVGPVAELLKAEGADGLVMAIGYQAGCDKTDKNWLSIAVVEPQGSIIWYNLTSTPEHFNFQHEEGIRALVADTMYNFWEKGS